MELNSVRHELYYFIIIYIFRTWNQVLIQARIFLDGPTNTEYHIAFISLFLTVGFYKSLSMYNNNNSNNNNYYYI